MVDGSMATWLIWMPDYTVIDTAQKMLHADQMWKAESYGFQRLADFWTRGGLRRVQSLNIPFYPDPLSLPLLLFFPLFTLLSLFLLVPHPPFLLFLLSLYTGSQ
jgi:hypothetical protein